MAAKRLSRHYSSAPRLPKSGAGRWRVCIVRFPRDLHAAASVVADARCLSFAAYLRELVAADLSALENRR